MRTGLAIAEAIVWAWTSISATTGCSSVRADERAGDLAVAVAIEPSRVEIGGTARITVTVSNQSSAEKTLQFTSSCLTKFEVLDGEGRVIGSGIQMCLQSLTTRVLPAGGSFTDVHEWGRRRVDMPRLAPGTYGVRGVLLSKGDTVRSAPATVVLP